MSCAWSVVATDEAGSCVGLFLMSDDLDRESCDHLSTPAQKHWQMQRDLRNALIAHYPLAARIPWACLAIVVPAHEGKGLCGAMDRLACNMMVANGISLYSSSSRNPKAIGTTNKGVPILARMYSVMADWPPTFINGVVCPCLRVLGVLPQDAHCLMVYCGALRCNLAVGTKATYRARPQRGLRC